MNMQPEAAPRPEKERVYAELRLRIISGGMPPGSPVSERELAGEFGLSRTPIREVLRRLQLNGLIEIYPHRGAFVRRPDPTVLVEIFEVREAIEPLAAGLAALRHTAGELTAVRRRLESVRITDVPSTVDDAVRAGTELHDAIVRWAGNALLAEFYARLKDQASLIRLLTRRSREIEEASQRAHLVICVALGRRDKSAAEEAMRTHLVQTRNLLLQQYQAEG